MVSINYSAREVCCKIVYYGPGLSGKTTNLQYVHSKVPSTTRGKLISLATEADRTLYFDFLPLNIGTINGFTAKFQLYTVPGQVYYNATRKLVLRGVDGVVFVADSQPDKMDENVESLSNLEENLREYGYDIDTMPMVIQYNKQDLPGVLPIEALDQRLNTRGWPSFGASATIGNGVFDTLKKVIKLVLDRAKMSGKSAEASSPKLERTAAAAPAPQAAPVQQAAPEEPPSAVPEAPQPEAAEQPLERVPVSTEQEPNSVQIAAATIASTTAAAVAAPAQPEPAPQAAQPEPAYRPYPGSTGRVPTAEQQTEPEAVTAVDEDKGQTATTVTTDSPGVSPDTPGQASQSGLMDTPQMAPSLKRRGEKKRGFFKRLFGIR